MHERHLNCACARGQLDAIIKLNDDYEMLLLIQLYILFYISLLNNNDYCNGLYTEFITSTFILSIGQWLAILYDDEWWPDETIGIKVERVNQSMK